MEYLMTYGWAILIIAVVLAALFQLGVFSGVMSPRAQPGTCRVVRPMGAGTSAYASLQGVCTGLLPQFVAQFSGVRSWIDAGNSASLTNLQSLTYSVWIYPNLLTYGRRIISKGDTAGYNDFFIGSAGNNLRFLRSFSTTLLTYETSTTIPTRSWTYVAVTMTGTTAHIYINGVETPYSTSTNGVGTLSSDAADDLYMGTRTSHDTNAYFNGSIANVQIYNTSLSANEILALYKEGIGGAPIRVDTLAGWWPLNGNANDTSGNRNNGVPTNIVYSSSWTNGYALR